MSGQHRQQHHRSTSVAEPHSPLRALPPHSVAGVVGATVFAIDIVTFAVLAVIRENATVAEADDFTAVLGVVSVVLIVLNLAAVIIGSIPRLSSSPR